MSSKDYPIFGRGEPRPAFETIVDLWRHALDRAGDAIAIQDSKGVETYRSLWESAHQVAGMLVARGCSGKCVAIVMPNSVDLHIAYLAALLAGSTPALLNPGYSTPQIVSLLALARPRVALTTIPLPDGGAGASCEILNFHRNNWVGDCSRPLAQQFEARPGDPAVMLFTGGTTGLPKAIVHSHAAMANAVRAMEYVWPTRTTGEVWLPVAPMSHIYGYLMGVLNPVYGAAHIVVPERFKPEILVDLIQRYQVTVLGGGPASVYAGLLAATNRRDADLSSLAVCPAGGASIPVALIEQWRRETGLQIFEAYGMTELAPIAGSSDHAGRKDGSVGRPLPLNEVEIVDAETGTRCLAAGETGEIRARGPSAMSAYVDRPEETANTLRDGWIYTGDLGHLDAEGFLFVTDRKKDMVLVKGFNVFPRVVEEALLTHPSLRAATVIGFPDGHNGERLVAFVVGQAGIDAAELRQHASLHLASYMLPSEFRFLSELPLTAAGKPDRQAMQALMQ